ncbi:MAG TPA: hypothetical protein VF754_09365, partial [Pyrinomonadaceae bacterium]
MRSLASHARARLLLLILLALLSMFVGAGSWRLPALAQMQPLEREIGGGDIHSYRLTLSAGQL